MTILGASWGLGLLGLTPLAKLVALKLGDRSDTDGVGQIELDTLEEWCCADSRDVLTALKHLESVGVEWSAGTDNIFFQLPEEALPPNRKDRAAGPEWQLHLYVFTGRAGTKIGISGNVKGRAAGLRQAMLDDSIKVQWSTSASASVIRQAERLAHTALSANLIRNEWFNVSAAEAISAAEGAIEHARNQK